MKNILLLFSLIVSANASGCICLPQMMLEKYTRSSFVALVRIEKNLPNKDMATNFYVSEITIQKLYKGNSVTSIKIEGNSDGVNRSSCDLFFKEGTEMLVYADESGNGQYIFNSCSGYRVLGKKDPRDEQRSLEMLDYLAEQKIDHTDKTWYDANLNLPEYVDNNPVERNFAIYELSFGDSLKVDSVRTLTGFNQSLDRMLIDKLKRARWVGSRFFHNRIESVNVPGKLLVAFYYYPSKDKYPAFITEHDL